MSLKERIFDALVTLDLPLAYNDSNVTKLPRLNYFLISNYPIRLSNSKHRNITRYQVDLFSDIPRDVESDDLLSQIEETLLKSRLKCSNWFEVSSIDADEELGIYHYYVEVWV